MEAAIISPIPLLERYSSLGRVQLVLAQHWEDPVYRKFMTRRSLEYNDFVILDNGAYELGKSIELDKYLDIAYQLLPNVVAIPDVIMDSIGTLNLFESFLEKWDAERSPGTKLMPVPQGTNKNDWEECFGTMWLLGSFEWWAIPKVYVLISEGESRRGPADMIVNLSPDVNIHLFGIWADPIQEVLEMSGLSNVKSIDSQLPVTLGHLGRTLEEFRPHPHGEPFDSDKDPYGDWTLGRVAHFIEIARANGGQLFEEEPEFKLRT